jgi:hypothetical protein
MSSEDAMGLFAPEVVLPVQMSWGGRGDGDISGARALMLAILEDALRCIQRGRRRRHKINRQLAEAEAWVREESREWLFAFANICDVLGIDADALRVRLLSNVEHPANGAGAARTAADELSTRSGAVARPLSQPGTTRRPIAIDAARVPARRTLGGRETGTGFGVQARLGVA